MSCKGPHTSLHRTGNLLEFIEEFNQDIFKTGSAVSVHLPNPQDHTKPQLNVLQLHALFLNLTEARKLAKEPYKRYDEYNVCTDMEKVERFGTPSNQSFGSPLTA
jgi:hypothetical protein